MKQKNTDKVNLNNTLKQCEKSALNGYNIALSNQKVFSKIINNAKVEIENTIKNFRNSKCYFSDANNTLTTQLIEIQNLFNLISTELSNDLEKNKKNLSDFSITLFGRTMAGKSTLMEVLTNGRGESIGLGSQRTTRDIRSYKWNNLKITDIPGIGAFEGEEDEKIAFEEAKSADLILFLIHFLIISFFTKISSIASTK